VALTFDNALRQVPTGDFKAIDLTPPGENKSGRIVKNMRIAGSGIYTYGRWELPSLLTDAIPSKYDGKFTFNVFRPPEVIQQAAPMFARQPITINHPGCYVTKENASKLQHGLTGDSVMTEVDPSDGETYMYTTGTLTTDEGIQAYEQLGHISLGYDPVVVWQDGVYKGKPYQLVMLNMKDGNHVAIVKDARGGKKCEFVDRQDGSLLIQIAERLENGGSMDLINSIKTKLGLTRPAGDGVEKGKLLLSTLVDGADPVATIKAVQELIKDVPAGDSKTTLSSYLTELSTAKNVDKAVMVEAIKMCHALMDTLTPAPATVTAPTPTVDSTAQLTEVLATMQGNINALTEEVKKLALTKPAVDSKPEEKKPDEPKPDDGTTPAPQNVATNGTNPPTPPSPPAADSKPGALTAPVTTTAPTTDSNKFTSDGLMSALKGGR